jgi:hypothetical protein
MLTLTLGMEFLVPRTSCWVGDEAEAGTFRLTPTARACITYTSQHFQVHVQANAWALSNDAFAMVVRNRIWETLSISPGCRLRGCTFLWPRAMMLR